MSAVNNSSVENLLKSSDSTARSSALSNRNGTNTSQESAADQSLQSIGEDYTAFLTLLTTQLKNQDPSKPMSTDSFTSELALLAGVEQQVETNQKLSTLISLNESSQLSSDSNLVGKTATAKITSLPLQGGKASLSFDTEVKEPIAISVANSSGMVVKEALGTSQPGTNTWSWDGKDMSGNQLPNGQYFVSVKTMDSAGNTADVPFTVSGKISSVSKGDDDLEVNMGQTEIPMSSIVNISS